MAHHEQLDQKLNVDPCSHLHHFSKLSFSLIIYSTIKKASNISSSRHPDPKKERVLEEGGQISPARVQASKWGNSPIPFFLESRPFREVFGGFGGGGYLVLGCFSRIRCAQPFCCFTYFQRSGSDPFPSIRYRRGTHTAQCETREAQQLRSHDNLAECIKLTT